MLVGSYSPLYMAASILQIAYTSTLLQTRQMILEQNGYKVVSALGNDQGIASASTGCFDVIMVGFSERHSTRKEVIRRLRQCAPNIPVVVLLAHEYERFPDADFATLSEDPNKWLGAVADCVKSHRS